MEDAYSQPPDGSRSQACEVTVGLVLGWGDSSLFVLFIEPCISKGLELLRDKDETHVAANKESFRPAQENATALTTPTPGWKRRWSSFICPS